MTQSIDAAGPLGPVDSRNITVVIGDILDIVCDAVVCPSNSYLTSNGGLAAQIARAAGPAFAREVQRHAPVPPGAAVALPLRDLPARNVIFAPTTRDPLGFARPASVQRALTAALSLCAEEDWRVLAVPGMGTGAGSLPYEAAAGALLAAVRTAITSSPPHTIVFVAHDKALATAFTEAGSNPQQPQKASGGAARSGAHVARLLRW